MQTLRSLALFLCLLGVSGTAGAASSYEWNAEFVSVDHGARTMTVKARMVSAEALDGIEDIQSGDGIIITWSGHYERAHGIRRVNLADAQTDAGQRFQLRAIFETVDPSTRYLTFTLIAPADSLAALAHLAAGEWATLTSSHEPSDAHTIQAVTAYGATPARTPTPVVAAHRADSYRWHAELVARDVAAGTVTMKSRIVSRSDRASLTRLHTGDAIRITWSGMGTRTHGIRRVEPAHGATRTEDFQLPATFIAVDPTNTYLTFRVRTPAGGLAAVTDLAPGEWTTVTSAHDPRDPMDAVRLVDAYDRDRRARRYTWPGEVLAVDASTHTVSVSAPVEPHVFRYVDRFSPGEDVVLIWAPSQRGEAVGIRYLEPRAGSILDHGYVLPVQYSGVDERHHRLTFTARVPQNTLQSWSSLAPGTHIRATALFAQGGETAAILSVERSASSEPTSPSYIRQGAASQ